MSKIQKQINGCYDSPLIKLKRKIESVYYDKEKYAIGRLLTIVDGLIKDNKQNKAVKDMIHEVFVTKTFFWDRLDEELIKFRDINCKDIENGYEFTLKKTDFPEKNN